MDLKQKIQKAFGAYEQLKTATVLRVKPVSDKYIAYLTSPNFEIIPTIDRYRWIDEALAAESSPVTREERKSIDLFSTYSPEQVAAIRRMRRRRKAKLASRQLRQRSLPQGQSCHP